MLLIYKESVYYICRQKTKQQNKKENAKIQLI